MLLRYLCMMVIFVGRVLWEDMQTLVIIRRLATEIVAGSLQGVFHLKESKLCHCMFPFNTLMQVGNMASKLCSNHQYIRSIYIFTCMSKQVRFLTVKYFPP